MMKHFLVVLSILFLSSCSQKETIAVAPNKVKIIGLIANNTVETIQIIGKGKNIEIPVQKDGTFEKEIDAKNIDNPYFTLYDGKNRASIYLDKGKYIKIFYDANDFKKTLKFTGNGAATSQFFIDRNKINSEAGLPQAKRLLALEKDEFEKELSKIENKVNDLLSNKNIEAKLVDNAKAYYKRLFTNLRNRYKGGSGATGKNAMIGKPSPKFDNYENFDGTKTSLDDLKGSYVYIDIWATWCGPCKREIPYLQKLEEKFKGKNIKFVSISVDDARRNGGSRAKAKEKWMAMVKAKNMGGIHLFSDAGWESYFVRSFGVRSIPRFLLIDKEGNVLKTNALRPSNPNLEMYLNSLKGI